jgi:hypothetical protein
MGRRAANSKAPGTPLADRVSYSRSVILCAVHLLSDMDDPRRADLEPIAHEDVAAVLQLSLDELARVQAMLADRE